MLGNINLDSVPWALAAIAWGVGSVGLLVYAAIIDGRRRE